MRKQTLNGSNEARLGTSSGRHTAQPCAQRLTVAAALAMGAVVIGPARAAEVSAGGGLEEIVVTAQRYEENLQKVPLAVSAFDSSALEDLGVKNVVTLGQYVPNMISNAGARGDTAASGAIYIRGVGQSDSYPNADQGVGVYIDGVYLSRWKGSLYEVNDIDRVEVLRGPQGTLYGKNTIGGALNVITAKPQGDLDYRIGAGYGRFDAYELEGMVNVPISDALWFRAAVRGSQDDGYIENRLNDTRIGDRDYTGGRFMLRWHPDGDLDINLSAEVHRDRSYSAPTRLIDFNPDSPLFGTLVPLVIQLADLGAIAPIPGSIRELPTFGSYLMPPGSDPREGGSFNHVGRNELDVYMGTLTIEKGLTDSLRLKSITSYRGYDAFDRNDDGTPLEVLSSDTEQEQWQASQELQIIGNAFDDRLALVSGLYWFKERSTNEELFAVAPDLLSVLYDLGIVRDFGRGLQFSTLKSTQQNVSAFAQGTWSFTDRLRGILGLRWTREQREISNRTEFPTSDEPTTLVNPPERTFTAFTPRFGIDFDVSDDALLYASAAKGFKSGLVSFRGVSSNEQVEPVDPEVVWSYEIGLKSRWLDDRLQLNAAAFYSDYTDMQLVTVVVDADTQLPRTVVRNAGEATMQGAEIELIAKPVPRIELIGSFGVLSTEYGEFMDTDPLSGEPIDRSNNDLPFAPRRTAAAIVRYLQPLPNGSGLTAQAGWNYRSDSQLATINTPNTLSEAYSLYNARLSYNSPSGRTIVTLYGENLSDEFYKVYAQDTGGAVGQAQGAFGRPRTYGVRVNYSFK